MKQPDVHELLTRFAATISNGALGLIDNAPESSARPMESLKNVLQKMQQDGGRIGFGWVFLSRASVHGEYLIALHHAIWNPAASTAYVDITPFHEDPKYRPYCPAPAKVLFLMDETAQPKMIGSAISPLPSRFFAATDDPTLLAYVEQLNQEEQTHFQKLSAGGIAAPGSQRAH
jgi:hypothetical protein